ncbi:type II secretion system protein N [Acinetobacter sichuanensis]|uniref:Type II secretion system protein N n=1 Tax=Acinetobacter sichuanensis TaxID=2136183 RepID=A0A371YPD0_9GAMM|nr:MULTISPECIES: type II secretion system protein N [Acinetobacter]MDM1249125.1 type II secretion system protein N [Acinetobacter sp. R933-2]MDM1765188.1 type II secretion system protein N [Acinetobacter sp. 226-1]MDM1768464.1 type II secretion system protein N [Acinetobacter sp. 226-4]MDQ9023032.1 type II secretion system protein N [Acinetobacter sichuanensis]RFC83335.1 general secretion pathway protein [Acinetobacter sichuanensis]
MNKKSKQITWWIVGVVAFLIFVLLQVPATWLISKFYKNNQTLQNVSGNIWQGQADWHKDNLRGSVTWRTRPFDLILLRAGANVEIHSGQTQLAGVVAYGLGQRLTVKNMTGQIAPETLKTIVDWQWPTNAIQLKDVGFKFKKDAGFSESDGQLQWAGGELIYTYAQRQDRMNMPSLNGQLKDESGKLIFDIQDQRSQKMVNITLDPSMMLDVQLTQRFLLNVPSYDGKAGLDTYVISSRQPLLQGGS